MKKHMVTHSCTEIHYKCEECDFVGQNKVTMEVHMGKNHSEKFEHGLCELEADSLANLEIHLNTCEMFQCDKNECNKRFKTIKEIKEHIKKEHKDYGYGYLDHLKLDRNNCNKVTEKPYRSDKI